MTVNAKSYVIVHLFQQADVSAQASSKDARGSFLLPYFCDVTTWDDLYGGIEFRLNAYYVEHAPRSSSDLLGPQVNSKEARNAASVRLKRFRERLPECASRQFRSALASGGGADHLCSICEHSSTSPEVDNSRLLVSKRIFVKALVKESSEVPFRSCVQTRRAAAAHSLSHKQQNPQVIPRSTEVVSDSSGLDSITCLFELEDVNDCAALAPLRDHAEWYVNDAKHFVTVSDNLGSCVRRPVHGQTTVGEFVCDIASHLGVAGVRSFFQESSNVSVFFLERMGSIVGFSDVWSIDVIPGDVPLVPARTDVYLETPAETPVLARRKVARLETSVTSTVNTYRVVSSRATSGTYSGGFGTAMGAAGGFQGGWLGDNLSDSDTTEKRSRFSHNIEEDDGAAGGSTSASGQKHPPHFGTPPVLTNVSVADARWQGGSSSKSPVDGHSPPGNSIISYADFTLFNSDEDDDNDVDTEDEWVSSSEDALPSSSHD